LLQQLTLPPPPPPADRPALSVERPETAHATSTTPISVKQIRITGNTLLPTSQLHALVAAGEGQTLTLGELQELAEHITKLYHERGYLLARAYVPAQTIQDGEITFAVLEASYGRVALNNTSTTSDRPLSATLAPLANGAPVSEAPLDRSLLLLSDIPGVVVSSTLLPGTKSGTSDLQVDVASAPRYSGLVAVDDFGNRYTGRTRGTGVLYINSFLHEGDKLDANLLSSGSGMSYGELGYHYLLNGQGTTLGVASSYLHYQLTGSLSDLQAHGTAQVDSVNLTQPIIRSTAGNLYAHVEFDHRQLHDDIDVASIRSDRHTNGWSAVLAGDRRDDHGVTNFNLSVAVDQVEFDGDAARIADRLGANTQGSGSHYGLTLARLQQLDRTDSLYFAFTGQIAGSNLDPADQFSLGGPSNARGYDVGAVTGADGYVTSAEWRHALGVPWTGAWLGSLFADLGHIQVYKNTFAPGTNDATLSDAGASLHWDGPQEWAVSAQVATRIGPSSPLLHSASRESAWLQVQKGF
jgi:hemolysin activation/secretion protein